MGVIPLLTLLEKPIIILQLRSLYVFYPVLLSPILRLQWQKYGKDYETLSFRDFTATCIWEGPWILGQSSVPSNFTSFSCAQSSSKPSKISFVVRSSATTRGSIGTAWKKLRIKIHKFTFFKVKPLNVYEVWIAHLIEPNAPFTPNQ